MPTNLNSDWADCEKFRLLPFKNPAGRWEWPGIKLQSRRVMRDGALVTEYRNREETAAEFYWRQI